eukprot:GFKZ01005095.1.p1 GENE.GFKZ01005095.1~~GFKZ01005095.1.p1  ORF type:complete len:713 (-),score=123.00 GFKZ01005095.1:445-2583(-)
MLGSRRHCVNCHGTSFRRVKVNRTVQCESCDMVLEERCITDLTEYYATTQTEEVQCVVTADHMHNNIVDDIPSDPFCTAGFITAFRMLSPLREPVYAASARTMSGSLAEMERVIGDALFSGYVGYNGRAPGGATRTDEQTDPSERNKSGGEARHTVVAYFEIVELANRLGVDNETSNLAIRIFRHTANNTSLRNRNVEYLATAAFVAAAERRWLEYQEWKKVTRSQSPSGKDNNTDRCGDVSDGHGEHGGDDENGDNKPDWPIPPRQLTVEEISNAANLDATEVRRSLKVVNGALQKQRPENSSCITSHMPAFCEQLELADRTKRLAIGIAENALQKNICSRRNPVSISAAAIYLACQLDGVRKTQTEICRATSLTEVTLRKVYKELHREEEALVPEWFRQNSKMEADYEDRDITPAPAERTFARRAGQTCSGPASTSKEVNKVLWRAEDDEGGVAEEKGQDDTVQAAGTPPLPPPLPPGFVAMGLGKSGEKENATAATTVAASAGPSSNGEADLANGMMAMLQAPGMRALASAMSMMPQLMPTQLMPPPPLPPPLPPMSGDQNKSEQKRGGGEEDSMDVEAKSSQNVEREENEKREDVNGGQEVLDSGAKDMLAGMQSMMGLFQAMQAMQTFQSQGGPSGVGGGQVNPLAMMAMALAQAQNVTGALKGAPRVDAGAEKDKSEDNGTNEGGGNQENNGKTNGSGPEGQEKRK